MDKDRVIVLVEYEERVSLCREPKRSKVRLFLLTITKKFETNSSSYMYEPEINWKIYQDYKSLKVHYT